MARPAESLCKRRAVLPVFGKVTSRLPPDRRSAGPAGIFVLLAAIAAALGTAGLLRGFGAAPEILLAASAGVFADQLLSHSADEPPSWIRLSLICLAAGFAGFATWTVVLLRSDQVTASSGDGPAPAQVEILSPPAGAAVRATLMGTRGRVSGLRQGEVIWLMAQTVGDERYYLMANPCPVDSRGRWRCGPVYLGPDRVDHHRYRIWVRILDGEALNQAIERRATSAAEGQADMPCPSPFGRAGGSVVVQRFGPA